MALNSADKRNAAVYVMMPWRTSLPLPDGAINQGDRQQAATEYRGILAAPLVVVPNPGPHARTGESGWSSGTWSDPAIGTWNGWW